MVGTMESIEEYLRSLCGLMQKPLAYIIRKTITIHIYGNYPKYETPDDEIINNMLYLPP